MLCVTQLSGFGAARSPGSEDIVNWADFSSAYCIRGADLTGNADGKNLTVSFWFNIKGGNGLAFYVCNNGGSGLSVLRESSNVFKIKGWNAAGTLILDIRTTATYTTTSNTGAHHLMATAALATAGAAHIYVDGIEDTNVVVFTDDTIDFTKTDFAVGAITSGAGKFNGCLGQVYINLAEYDNTPTDYYNNGPVNFGSTGANPTGTAPLVFLNNSLSTFETNLGTGGGLTETGTLTACT